MYEWRVHEFKDCGTARISCFSSDVVDEGHVLVVRPESVGVIVGGHAFAVTSNFVPFRTTDQDFEWANLRPRMRDCGIDYRASLALALAKAREIGAAIPVEPTSPEADDQCFAVAYQHWNGRHGEVLSLADKWGLYCMADGMGRRRLDALRDVTGGLDWKRVRDSIAQACATMASWLRGYGYGLEVQV